MNDAWIADRMKHIDASGIRKAFDMAKSMKDPINLSIGLPDFDVAEPVKAAAIDAIELGQERLHRHPGNPRARRQHPGGRGRPVPPCRSPGPCHRRDLGCPPAGLCCVVNPGDEVIVFDPYFVMYRHLVTLAGGTSVLVDTYPDFRIDTEQVEAAITARTKCVIVNSPVTRPASSPRPRRCAPWPSSASSGTCS